MKFICHTAYDSLAYLGLSGLGGLSMKLLLVALEMGITGMFFNKDEDSEVTKRRSMRNE